MSAPPRPLDLCVVGGGPAGVAAACRAAEAGCSVAVVDEGFAPGGQIWRRPPGAAPPPPGEASRWLARLARSGAALHPGTAIAEVSGAAGAWRIAADHGGSRVELHAGRLLLASGARELILPFPGWTLPMVAGAGGLQALAKSGLEVAGRRVVLAGSGPLLLAVSTALADAGAEIAIVAEQASEVALAALGVRLLGHPGKLLEGTRHRRALGARYRAGWWVARAEGGKRLEAAVLSDGRSTETVACDLLGVSHGLVPATELAQLLGAVLAGGAVVVDARQETSVPGLLAAGEVCGVAGAEVALAEGQIAGLSAAGRAPEAELVAVRRRGRSLAAAMERTFALRPELLRPPPPDTVICRCEDVRLAELDPAWTGRQGKLLARAGMGACQGRTCGPALSRLLGWEAGAVRPPLRPVPLASLLTLEERP